MPGRKDLVPRKDWERSPLGLCQPSDSLSPPVRHSHSQCFLNGQLSQVISLVLGRIFIISRVLQVPTLSLHFTYGA